MSEKGQRLRALVTERLTAAAEEIFALVERTIAEYEEELCRCKEENRRKQQLLEPQILLHRTADVQVHSLSPESRLMQKISETPQIKEEPEEQGVEQEEEQLPQVTAVCVEREESALHQRQGEPREEQPHDSYDADDWEPAASTSPMEAEADGDHYSQVPIRDTHPAAHNSALFTKYTSAAESAAAGQRGIHECPICSKRFTTKHSMEKHSRIHTGERPYICTTCGKAFHQKYNLSTHMSTHTGEKPYSCPNCGQAFSRKGNLVAHMRRYTGEKPFRCSLCDKGFSRRSSLGAHLKTHGASVSLELLNLHQNFYL